MQDGRESVQERREPRRSRQAQAGRPRTAADWTHARYFVWEDDDRQLAEPPTVELTYRAEGPRILWSHTPGRMRDEGEQPRFVPTMHLSDRDITAYRTLLLRSATEASALRRQARAAQGGNFTVPPADTVLVHAHDRAAGGAGGRGGEGRQAASRERGQR